GEEDCAQGRPLPAGAAKGQQKCERIPEADLGERVLEGEIGLGASERAQKEAEDHQQKATPDGVEELLAKALAFADTAGDGIRQGYAYQERKPRLDGVVEAHSGLGDVGLV